MYTELNDALNAFRLLFQRQIVPSNEINHSKEFLQQVAPKNGEYSIVEAIKLYGIIKPYSDKLKQVGFDFTKVPIVSISGEKPKAVVVQQQDNVIGYDGQRFVVKLSYNPTLVEKMRAIPKREYDIEKKLWYVPISSMDQLKEFANSANFDIGEAARKMMNNIQENLEQSYSAEYIELNLPVKMQFYPYQTVGVDYIRKNKWVINADVMGLGKSSQGIGGVLINNSFPCLVICPKGLRLNWKDEWNMWTDKKVMILSAKNIDKLPYLLEQKMIDVVITNYDGVNTFFVNEIKEIEITQGPNKDKKYKKVYTNGMEKLFKGIICDEAHHTRNRKALRFKYVKKCFEDKETRICLTGTPVVKGPQDMAALLDLIGRIDDFGGHYKFTKQYKGLDKKMMALMNKPSSELTKQESKLLTQLGDLNIKLRSTCFIRREKHQVLKDLPDKFRKIIRVPLENQKDYDHAMFSLQSYLAESGASDQKLFAAQQAEILVKVGILKQLSSKGKFNAVKEFAEDLIEQDEKVIIVCWFNETVQMLKDNLKHHGVVTISGKIDGHNTTDEEIQEAKKKFQNDPNTKIIIITYGKGGEGHTLTAASNVLLMELGWTYKDQGQIEDRAHRIGQKFAVDCYYFLGEGTIDEHIYNIINSRMKLEKESTGGTEEISTTFSQLIKNIQKND